MAYDPTRRVPPPGYAPPQVPPGYPPQSYPVAGQSPSGFVPGYAPPQVPPGYAPQPQQIVTAYGTQPGMPGYSGSFWVNLGRPGQGALLSALALLIAFFLPWLSTPDFNNTRSFSSTFIPLTTFSGFSTASGITINVGGSTPPLNFNLFASIWIVLAGAVGLLIIVWLLSQHRITARTANATMLVISLAILLVALAFLLQVNAIENVIVGVLFSANRTPPETLVSVSTGFWVGVIAAAVALLTSAYGVSQGGKTPAGGFQ